MVQVHVAPPHISPGQRTWASLCRDRYTACVPHPCQMDADWGPFGHRGRDLARGGVDPAAIKKVGVWAHLHSWVRAGVSLPPPSSYAAAIMAR